MKVKSVDIKQPLKYSILPQDVAAATQCSRFHCVNSQAIMREYPEVVQVETPASSPLVRIVVRSGRGFKIMRATIPAAIRRDALEFDKNPDTKVWTHFGPVELGVPPKSLKTANIRKRARAIREGKLKVKRSTKRYPVRTGRNSIKRTLTYHEADRAAQGRIR